jgi:hypothetical protein
MAETVYKMAFGFQYDRNFWYLFANLRYQPRLYKLILALGCMSAPEWSLTSVDRAQGPGNRLLCLTTIQFIEFQVIHLLEILQRNRGPSGAIELQQVSKTFENPYVKQLRTHDAFFYKLDRWI